MKIDLHCHTKATKKGDGEARNVTPDIFREKVANADVKIVAITNHNHFDINQYKALQFAVKDFCQVWPGVEIDIQGKTRWHLIVVANPENVRMFHSRVSELFSDRNIDKCALSIEEAYKALDCCDVIYIPHYHKSPGISEEDRKKLSQLIGDESRVFLELSNHRSLGIYTNHGYRSLVGSDIKDWNKYEQSDFAEIKLPVENFSQFCLLAKRDETIVETLLNKKQSIELVGKPHESVSINIKLYQDVNILFGPKGTGKSELVKSLCNDMSSKGLSCVNYSAQDRSEEFKRLTSLAGMERDLTKVNACSCEEDFDVIANWKDSAITTFDNYLNWYQTRDNSANKCRMKITEATALSYTKTDKYNQHKKDKEACKRMLDEINSIDLSEYLKNTEQERLVALLKQLYGNIQSAREIDLIDEFSTKLTNSTISIIKVNADRNTDTVSRPSATGLSEYAENRINLRTAVDHILTNLNLPEFNEKEYLGELEEKGKIYINHRYRFLQDKASYTKEFDSSIGINRLKDIVASIKDISENIFADDMAARIDALRQKLEASEITSLKPFLGISKFICDENGDEYIASNGEQGILLLQRNLQKDADAYFIDEPELGMGGSYIDATIRPLIINLAKQRKYVVVATHNANIAVRTLPYTSIFRTHENGKYMTYVGNPFNDTLENIENPRDTRSWAEESLHTLEGGYEAFYERRDIYESKNN
jgi:ABC-type cobalamin/Fe3+-siderophores transport system ATPase subunit